METAKRAGIITIIVFAMGACLSIGNGIETAGETVQQFAPIPQATAQIALDRREQEAQVTATYIAVLSSEVVSDTMNSHAIMRDNERQRAIRTNQLETIANYGKMSLVVSLCLFCGIVSVGLGYGIARRASTVPLRDGAHLLPSGNWIDTRTALVSGTRRERLPEMHARDLLEYRAVVVKSLVGAFKDEGVKLLTGRDNGENN